MLNSSRHFLCKALTIIAFLTIESQARVDSLAFNDISQFFKDPHYSPTLGMTALDSGLIHNLRFCGDFTPAYNKDGGRDYIKDKSEDPLWNLVYLLFPSPAGQLASETMGYQIGRFTNIKTVVWLLETVYQIRKGTTTENERINSEFLNKILNIPEDIKPEGKTTLNKNVKKVLNHIKGSVQKEKESIYPEYTTEQVILAFFCEKFNGQKDIIALIKALGGNKNTDIIVMDEEKLQLVKPFNPGTIDSLLKIKEPTIDDFYNLANFYGRKCATPYKPNTTPLSNGRTEVYNRSSNQLLPSKTFADCVEIAIRHLLNLILYNDKTQYFELTGIKNYIQNVDQKNPYIQNFESFYNNQPPAKANDGSIEIRSLWNKVVGDLNSEDEQSTSNVTYLKQVGQVEYELETGFINLISVFQKLFSFKLPQEQQTLDLLDLSKASLAQQQQWVQVHLETLFKILNPSREYDVETSKLSQVSNKADLFGELIIKVTKGNHLLFSFVFSLSTDHGELKKLHVPNELNEFKIPNNFLNIFKSETTSQESLNLLIPELRDQAQPSLYLLYPQMLADNKSIITALENVVNKEIKRIPDKILENLLKGISWDDPHVVKKVSPIIIQLQKIYPEIIKQQTKSLSLGGMDVNDEKLSQILKDFNNLERLDLGKTQNLKKVSLTGLTQLKFLILERSNVEEIMLSDCTALERVDLNTALDLKKVSLKGLTQLKHLNLDRLSIEEIVLNGCTSLEKVDLNSTLDLKKVSLKELTQLKLLSLINSSIKEIVGLNHCTTLDWLNLDSTLDLKKISVAGLTQLKMLSLEGSSVQEIVGLSECTALEKLNLNITSNLKEISVAQLLKLKFLNLRDSSIKVIKGLTECTALEELNLNNTLNLAKISVAGLVKLKLLCLCHSRVQEIEGLSQCTALEELNLSNTQNLIKISVAGLAQLKLLYLQDSNIEEIKGLNDCTELKELNLNNTLNLKEISVAGLVQLKILHLQDSIVKEIKGLNDCTSLESLYLKYIKNLKEISVIGLSQLKLLYLQDSNIQEIKGLNDCTSLESLYLNRTKNLKVLSVTRLSQLKLLYIQDSSIEEIKGLNECTSLERLELYCTEKLKEVLINGLAKLKSLNLEDSNIKQIVLNECTALEELNLNRTKNLTKVLVTGPTKLNSLDLKRLSLKNTAL